MSAYDTKTVLRKRLLARRYSIPQVDRHLKDQQICLRIKKWLLSRTDVSQLFLFYPTRSEPNLMLLRKDLPITLALPKISQIKSNNSMEFVRLDSWASFAVNRLGILEPTNSPPVEANQHTVVLTPCVSVSKNYERLGYGGGYYDRFFSRFPDVIKIGVCYQELMIETIPQEPSDIPLDGVVTESLIYFK